MPPFGDDAPSWLSVGDVRTALRRRGAGEPLLYLHGSGLTKRWLPIHESLAETFDVIAPEHPGYGDTVRPRWYRTLDDVALHYADLLDALEIERVHVVGHSLGGRIAGAFAGVFPERVRSLALLAPGPLDPGGTLGPPPWDDDPDEGDLPEDFDFDGLLFNDNQASYPEFAHGDDDGLVVADDDGLDPHAEPDAWTTDPAPTLYRRLRRLRCPSVVLVPDEDRLIPERFFGEWAAHIPSASVVRVHGDRYPTAHLFVVQEPDAIAREVRRMAAKA